MYIKVVIKCLTNQQNLKLLVMFQRRWWRWYCRIAAQKENSTQFPPVLDQSLIIKHFEEFFPSVDNNNNNNNNIDILRWEVAGCRILTSVGGNRFAQWLWLRGVATVVKHKLDPWLHFWGALARDTWTCQSQPAPEAEFVLCDPQLDLERFSVSVCCVIVCFPTRIWYSDSDEKIN